MKNTKKISLIALLGFALTVFLNVSSYANSFIIENEYADLHVEQAGIVSRSLSLKSKNLLQAPITTVAYSTSDHPLKSKVVFRIKDIILKKKQGIHESVIHVNNKRLKVTYFCDVKITPEDEKELKDMEKDNSKKKKKSKKTKKLTKKIKYKLKMWKNKIKEKFVGNKISDVYIKIVSAELDGKELPKEQK